jgi:hypothetical protein
MNSEFFQGHEFVAPQIAVMSLLEGLPSTFIGTLICMQYFKKEQ